MRGYVGVGVLLVDVPRVLGSRGRSNGGVVSSVWGSVGGRGLAIRACIIRGAGSVSTPFVLLVLFRPSRVPRVLLGGCITAAHLQLGGRVQDWQRVPGGGRRQLGVVIEDGRVRGVYVWAGNGARMWVEPCVGVGGVRRR